MTTDTATLRARLDAVRERIAGAGRDPDGVTIVGVTKGFGADAVYAAIDAGIGDLGENYAQELEGKAEALAARSIGVAPRWHFVGRLQRNKVRRIAGLVTLWHSIDRLSLGVAVADAAPGAHVLVQVNATDEAQKAGCPPRLVPSVVEGLTDLGLVVRGLMTIGVFGDLDATDAAFGRVRALADTLALPECSMGMSDDLEVAVRQGATIVRVGTALFGPRPSAEAMEH